MSKVIIFGTGEIAEVAHFYLSLDTSHEICGFTLDSEYIKESTFKGLPIVDFDNIEKLFPTDQYKIFIPISYKGVNKLRQNKYYEAKSKGYGFISYVSTKALYYNTPVGENCFILENNVIQPYSRIGNNVILWSGNHIGHHTTIKDHCFIASHVVISGGVTVESNTFIGVNATIRDNITIGKENVIGAGAIILKDTNDKAVYTSGNSKKLEVTSDELRRI